MFIEDIIANKKRYFLSIGLIPPRRTTKRNWTERLSFQEGRKVVKKKNSKRNENQTKKKLGKSANDRQIDWWPTARRDWRNACRECATVVLSSSSKWGVRCRLPFALNMQFFPMVYPFSPSFSAYSKSTGDHHFKIYYFESRNIFAKNSIP